MKILFAIILLVSSTVAADKAAVTRALAACGPVEMQFDVTTHENQHPTGQQDAASSLVYVVQDGDRVCMFCSTATRVGLDGTWMGANDGNSYFYFSVTPGDHHLCTDMQTESEDSRKAALAPFTAEPGKIYYFRARITRRLGDRHWRLDLDPINSDEGQLLVASSAFSTFQKKK